MAVREELIEIRDRVNRLLDLIVPDGASQQKASTSDSLRDAPHGMFSDADEFDFYGLQ